MIYHRCKYALLVPTVFAALVSAQQLDAASIPARFTWMLPKTVIDATIVYTYHDCINGVLSVNITPTLTPRPIPDLVAGQRTMDTKGLDSWWQDQNISVQTFGDTHLLNSLSSNPTSIAAQIISNVLGGITKLVAVGLQVAAVEAAPPIAAPTCAGDDVPNSAQSVVKQIKDLKRKIEDANAEIAKGTDDATQKKDTAAIQAAQNLITILQDKLTITIKTTIDPGFSSVLVDPYGDTGIFVPSGTGSVDHSGLVATFCPSRDQLKTWFSNSDAAFAGVYPCKKVSMLEVNVYLDFALASGTMYDATHQGNYGQTTVAQTDQYRDAAHIPVHVWRGQQPGQRRPAVSPNDFSGPPQGAIELISPQALAFGQFGVAQALPTSVRAFKSLTWSLTFSQSGEVSSASFTNKGVAAGVTSSFGNVASAINSIASEQRTAAGAGTEASLAQAKADAIYQEQRLKACMANPVNCQVK